MPIYYAINLWTAPSGSPTKSSLRSDLFVNPSQVTKLPYAIVIGLIIPTILMALPSPEWITPSQHNASIALWQFYPLWIAISHYILSLLAPPTSQAIASSIKSLRRLYAFSIALSTITHVAVLAISLNAEFASRRFSLGAATSFHPSQIFFPMTPFAVKDVSLREGCLHLLQYDLYFACGSSLIWALVQWDYVSPGKKLERLLKYLVLSLLCGPGSAALMAIWGRDEAVLGSGGEKEQKLL
jgi:hypothetical protein